MEDRRGGYPGKVKHLGRLGNDGQLGQGGVGIVPVHVQSLLLRPTPGDLARRLVRLRKLLSKFGVARDGR